MRGYGRDYDHRSWIDRAEDTVRGWFGGGRDYDRDYGWSGGRDVAHRDWLRGPDRARGEGYRTNNWNNQHASWSTVDRAGGYYGMDYQDRDRETYRAGGTGYDGDFGRDRDRGRMQGGMGRERGGWMGGRGTSGGMRGRGTMRGTGTGQGGDAWMEEGHGGGFGAAGGGWGDYGRGAYGGSAWRSSNAGGVEPGRYFRGYGNGSTGGHGYEPY